MQPAAVVAAGAQAAAVALLVVAVRPGPHPRLAGALLATAAVALVVAPTVLAVGHLDDGPTAVLAVGCVLVPGAVAVALLVESALWSSAAAAAAFDVGMLMLTTALRCSHGRPPAGSRRGGAPSSTCSASTYARTTPRHGHEQPRCGDVCPTARWSSVDHNPARRWTTRRRPAKKLPAPARAWTTLAASLLT